MEPSSERGVDQKPQLAKDPFFRRLCTWRYTVAFLCMTTSVVSCALKNSFAVALVRMTRPIYHGNDTIINDPSTSNTDSHYSLTTSNVTLGGGGEGGLVYDFSWSPSEQGLILASMYYTSFLSPLLASALMTWLPGKHVMTMSILLAGVVTLVTPSVARLGPTSLMVNEAVLGLLVGDFNAPIAADCLARWTPAHERLDMSCMSSAGYAVGGILGFFIGGALCSIPLLNGWPFVFYVFGVLVILQGLAWHFLCAQSPEVHPYISEKERQFIVDNRTGIEDSRATLAQSKEKTPYRKILTSKAVLVFIFVFSICSWFLNTFFSTIPMYFTNALHFNIGFTGVLAALTACARLAGNFLCMPVSTWLQSKCNLSVNANRKICFGSLFGLTGLFFVFITVHLVASRWFAFGLLEVSMLFQGAGTGVLFTIPLDMAPKYAGLIIGLSMSVGNALSFTGPIAVTALTPGGTEAQWDWVWLLYAAAFLTSVLVLSGLGSANMQTWACSNNQVKDTNTPLVKSSTSKDYQGQGWTETELRKS